jgi:hypothetical protein
LQKVFPWACPLGPVGDCHFQVPFVVSEEACVLQALF